MATTAAGEVEFYARVDLAERIGVYIEQMAALHGEAPIGDADLAGFQSVELFRDDELEPPGSAAPGLVPCDGCGGTGRMWTGSGEEMAQVRVTCVACGGEGEGEPGEEPADLDDDGSPSDEPEPPTPAAPNVIPFPVRKPFDRAAHCAAIAAGGGLATVDRYGVTHMRTIGKAGRAAYVAKYGRASWVALMEKKGWQPRRPDLAVDLALGDYLADAA